MFFGATVSFSRNFCDLVGLIKAFLVTHFVPADLAGNYVLVALPHPSKNIQGVQPSDSITLRNARELAVFRKLTKASSSGSLMPYRRMNPWKIHETSPENR